MWVSEAVVAPGGSPVWTTENWDCRTCHGGLCHLPLTWPRTAKNLDSETSQNLLQAHLPLPGPEAEPISKADFASLQIFRYPIGFVSPATTWDQ